MSDEKKYLDLEGLQTLLSHFSYQNGGDNMYIAYPFEGGQYLVHMAFVDENDQDALDWGLKHNYKLVTPPLIEWLLKGLYEDAQVTEDDITQIITQATTGADIPSTDEWKMRCRRFMNGKDAYFMITKLPKLETEADIQSLIKTAWGLS
jgi:hypothetical protein